MNANPAHKEIAAIADAAIPAMMMMKLDDVVVFPDRDAYINKAAKAAANAKKIEQDKAKVCMRRNHNFCNNRQISITVGFLPP
jgi:hypothetical protein